MIVEFIRFFMNVHIDELFIYLGIVVLWGGLYYVWNLIAIEITIDIMEYMDYKHPDLDYFTIPKIIERTKNKYGEQRLRWNNHLRNRAN
jgi:3-hydroxyacyl-CoA dehydrogenase